VNLFPLTSGAAKCIGVGQGRAMVRKTTRLLVLGGVLGLLATHASAQAIPHCCLCTGCTTGRAAQCATVTAEGSSAAACVTGCLNVGCGRSRVIACQEIDACADLVAPAPALSWQVLTALALALTVGGVYRTQRRLHT
jgi:hypothetical protein